ncbi:DNA repair protein RAD5 [Colletotrichum siamense]|uniref:DNA repair protein RAD5 n=1 Tax=Colletotrichum siamense TaxID=690259 RepID=A0A9P5ESD7_COLSI|nr:DNA repair protein RAD5 [Colletotrichum siamense]KAF4858718.1 DNA repair protein RAD5 [Colletotrichum siamense]
MDLSSSDDTASSSERPSNQYASTSPKQAESQNDIPDIQQQLLSEAAEPQPSTSPKAGHHAANEAQDEDDESDTKDEDSSDSDTEQDSDAADYTFQPEEESESEGQDESPDKKRKYKPKGKSTAGGSIAKTAQEKVRKKQSRLDRAFKNHIRNELVRKREFGELDVDIEPPRAKRLCIRFKKSKNTLADTDNMEIDDRDKPSNLRHDDRQITQKKRDEDLKGRVSHGTNNRRSGTQKRDLKEATGIFGNSKVKCFANGTYHLKGMRPDNRLKEEQLPAVSWMVQRERGIAPPYGGLLCDDTGLGKTMIAMACIVGNPPTQQDREEFSGTTLIILPSVDIRDQWRNEFKRHVEVIKDQHILTWHNAQFKKDGGDLTTLTGYKVVLTTIAELRQYPDDDKLQKLDQEHGRNSKEYREALAEIAGAIFGVKWYRIILDEGHAVKNQNTLLQIMLWSSEKSILWAHSDPIEMFPYIKLLGVEGIQTLNDLKNRFFKPHDSQTKLDALIHLITYRRTKKDEFLGRPMMECLPNFEAQEIWVHLSKQERTIYDAVTEHYALTIPPNKLGGMHCQRMLISHAWNLERALRVDFNPHYLADIRVKLVKLAGKAHLLTDEKISPRIPETIPKTEDSRHSGKNDSSETNGLTKPKGTKSKTKGKTKTAKTTKGKASRKHSSRTFHPKTTSRELGMESLLQYAVNEHIVDHEKCNKCGKEDNETPWVITECNHLFCYTCLSKTWRSASDGKCPMCGKAYDKEEGAHEVACLTTKEAEYVEADKATAIQEADSAPSDVAPKKKGKRAPKKPKKNKKLTDEQKKKIEKDYVKKKYGVDANGVFMDLKGDHSSFIRVGTHEANCAVLHSSKTACAMDVLAQWQREAPDDKIIVFHEFAKTGKILGMALNQANIPFVYLNGELSDSARPKAIKRFTDDPTVKVLLSSRVGKEGLNLTCANRLIIIDNWWNNAAELQAFGRIDRNGQKKRTHAVVIKAADTIDEYIENLQESKAEKVAHRLQDDKHEIKLMSEWEIMMHTAPEAYKAKCAQLIKEIEEEEEASEDEEEDAAEAAPGARVWVKV